LIDRVLTGLASKGHDVTLVCGGPVSEHEFKVVDAGGTYSQYLRAPGLCLSRFRNADVVIDAENGVPYFTPLWRRRPSVCLIHHVHTDQWQTRFPPFVAATGAFVERRVMPLVYRGRPFVAISRSTAVELADIGIREVTVIEPGIDLPGDPVPAKADEPLFLSLHRLVPHKRVDLLLRSWELAGSAIPGRLVVAGDGPELEALRRQAASIPRVEIVGRVSEELKRELLAQSWAVLSAAHHEGWGISLMEAAAVGTPTLAIDVAGVRDAVADGISGILIRSTQESDIPEALAKTMIDFVGDDQRRHALGSGALRRAREYSWDRCIARWESVLEKVAGSEALPAADDPRFTSPQQSVRTS